MSDPVQKSAEAHYGLAPLRTYHSTLTEMFHVTHEAGARRHPLYWLKANQLAAKAINDAGQKVTDTTLKTVVSLVLLRMLDWLQPVGLSEEPTDASIKAVLSKMPANYGDTWRALQAVPDREK